MMNIFLDLETCPAQNPAVRNDIAASITPPGNISKADTIALWHIEKKPAAVEEAWRKTSFDGAVGHICVIGIAIDDAPPTAIYFEDWHRHEAEALDSLNAIINAACAERPNERPVFIGHNLIEFDLRFLFQRSVVLGVKPSRHIPFAARPWDDSVFDTMARWDGKNRTSMDKLCRALGYDGKGDLDGSKVWDYVQAGRIAEVAEYCKGDIERTRRMFKRMNFMALEAA